MIGDSEKKNDWEMWNRQGLIPGPNETEDAYHERVIYCQALRGELAHQTGGELPFHLAEDHSSQVLLEEAFPLTEELYGIQPRWVPLFFSNYQLSPWHGGCAWIFQLDDEAPMAAFLQLRANFRSSSTYLGLYQRRELLAHELAHVGRMAYQDPQFEEIFAYQSSSVRWRRWLGPIVQSARETLAFILLLGVIILADLASLSLGFTFWPLKLLPIFLIIAALGRLAWRHYLYRACLSKLQTLYTAPLSAQHLLYRLTDGEIGCFARLSPQKIKQNMEHQRKHSFRWEFLLTLFPLSEQ